MLKTSDKRRSEMDPPLNIGKRIKVQAQRKFAQGAAVLPSQQKELSSINDGFKESPKDSTPFKIQTENKASTEDFLTYLCFKGSPSYNMIEPHLVSPTPVKESTENLPKIESKPLTTSMGDVEGFIPFGVRKQASQHPVKSTTLLEALKNNRKETSINLAKRNVPFIKQIQTRSSKLVKIDNARCITRMNCVRMNNGVKIVKKNIKSQVPKKLENISLSKRVTLRTRVVRFGNKLKMRRDRDETGVKNAPDKSSVKTVSSFNDIHTDTSPKVLLTSMVKPTTVENSPRCTRNMVKNMKSSNIGETLITQTKPSTLSKVTKNFGRCIPNFKTKNSPSPKQKVTQKESKSITRKNADFSSDDDEPLMKKQDTDQESDKPKAESNSAATSTRVTRSKQPIVSPVENVKKAENDNKTPKSIKRPIKTKDTQSIKEKTSNEVNKASTSKPKDSSSVKDIENRPLRKPLKLIDSIKPVVMLSENIQNNLKKRRFPFIDPTTPTTEAQLLATKRFAKSISTTDLDQQVIEESIKNMLRESTLTGELKKASDFKLEKSFSESDEEPLAAKIQEPPIKASNTTQRANTKKLPQSANLPAPPTKVSTANRTTSKKLLQPPNLSTIANNLTKKIIDSEQKTKGLSEQPWRKTAKQLQLSSTFSPSNIHNAYEEKTPPEPRVVPLTVNALEQETVKYLGRRVMKNNEYIENWIINCASLSADGIIEEWMEPDVLEPPEDEDDETPPEPAASAPPKVPQMNARPFSNMVADIDSRLQKNKYGAMSQLCMNSNSKMFEVNPYVEAKLEEGAVQADPNQGEASQPNNTEEPQPPPIATSSKVEENQPETSKAVDAPNDEINDVETKKIEKKLSVDDTTVNIYDFDETDSDIILPPRMIKEGEWKQRYSKEQPSDMKGFLPFNSIKKDADASNVENEVSQPREAESLNAKMINMLTSNNKTDIDKQLQEVQVNDKINSEGHLFYLPIHGLTRDGKSVNHIIEGVAVKKDTHGPDGQKKKVIMRAKLVMTSDLDANRLQSTSTDNPLSMVHSPETSSKINLKSLKPKQQINPPAVKKVIPTASVPPLTPSTNIVDSFPQMPNSAQSTSTKSNLAATRATSAAQKRVPSPWNVKENTKITNSGTTFPQTNDPTRMVDAPVFRPTEKEFQDPLDYIEKITPMAAKYGLCKIIPPPSFKPECKISDDMRFTPHNQYLNRMFYRWGTSSRELCAIKKYLATQNISFKQPPLLCGIEVDLPRMYHVVQNMGGLKKVLEKKLWLKVAEEMAIPSNGHYIDGRLDDIYCKYLLPYDTLSKEERQKLFESVDLQWDKRQKEMIDRASNPLNPPPETEQYNDEQDITEDIEECITRGKSQTLNAFARTAKNTMTMQFGKIDHPRPDEVELKFWDYVTKRNNHVCVSTGSIDSSVWGYGFPNAKIKNSPMSKHPWNLKVLTNNSGSVLRSLGPIMGVTVPTLHVGMLFSTCCWYRDPHGLPWVEFLHEGASKIWYSIPDSQSQKFRQVLTSLVPSYCQQKTIWLLSDTTMVPPALLTEHGVSLCRTVQNPGEFILVFPKAFTSSICTGFNVSESVYFATGSWLDSATQDFTDIRNSCEPCMFSLEKLIVAISEDPKSSHEVLKQILPMLNKIVQNEKQNREAIYNIGVKKIEKIRASFSGKKKVPKYQDEGEECHHCRTNLSLSMLHNPEDGSVFCLTHGVDYLKTNKNQMQNCKVVYTHTVSELEKIVEKLMERITLRANKKNMKTK